MESTAVDHIREAVQGARAAARAGTFDGCDMDDLEDVMQAVEQELAKPKPSPQMLTTYLNSLARSLRTSSAAQEACQRIDAAMQEAGLPRSWQQ